MELDMFFQESTPDTSGYMIAGFAVAFIVMALYVASIYLRRRNLERDMTMLDEIKEPAPMVQPGSARRKNESPARPGKNKSAKPVTKKTRKNY
jgi:hypothetical protein